MVVTSSRNGKTSPLSSMRRNGVSTADAPFYRSRDYRLTTGLPSVSRPFREKLHIVQLRAALRTAAALPVGLTCGEDRIIADRCTPDQGRSDPRSLAL